VAEAELTVSDLTDILRQSQPRISRHLKLLAEAGLVERFREGSWAFFRLAERGGAATLARELIARLDPDDPTVAPHRPPLAARRRSANPRSPPRCRMGSHPQAARRRRLGRRRDPLNACGRADALASGPRHRYRPHA